MFAFLFFSTTTHAFDFRVGGSEFDACGRSTRRYPVSLSISYFTGSPPCGISMKALTSCGGFFPMGRCSRFMRAP